MRKIPATIATQHPDHASIPYWKDNDAFISTSEEVEECYLNFAELGCSEYKWDWEGKLVDEAVIEKLYGEYYSYFEENPIGKDKFLTFRVPNPNLETDFRLPRAFFAIWAASALANELELDQPPLFEAILPMTESADDMIAIQEAYAELKNLKHKYYNPEKGKLDHIEMIPLFEEVDIISNSDKILEEYVAKHIKMFNYAPPYIRPYMARSDPALNAGIVPTLIAIKRALSKYKSFEEKHEIKLFPMLGAAALGFRGGLRPDNVDAFMDEYAGLKTTTIQSAFRYDYPKEQVIAAIGKLEKQLQQTKVRMIEPQDDAKLADIQTLFADIYRPTIENLAAYINEVAKQVPKRRARVQHIGLFGYSRGLGQVSLPRAITFTGSLYSLGVPPELISTGRGLAKLNTEQVTLVEQVFRNIKADLITAGRYLNKRVLSVRAKQDEAWKAVQQDIVELEKYLGVELGPQNDEDQEHEAITTKILEAQKEQKPLTDLILQAAKIRRSIG